MEQPKSGCGCGSNTNAKIVYGNKNMTEHQKNLISRIEKTSQQRKRSVYKTKTPLFN